MRVIYRKIRHARYLYIKRNVEKFGVRVIYRKRRYYHACFLKPNDILRVKNALVKCVFCVTEYVICIVANVVLIVYSGLSKS